VVGTASAPMQMQVAGRPHSARAARPPEPATPTPTRVVVTARTSHSHVRLNTLCYLVYYTLPLASARCLRSVNRQVLSTLHEHELPAALPRLEYLLFHSCLRPKGTVLLLVLLICHCMHTQNAKTGDFTRSVRAR